MGSLNLSLGGAGKGIWAEVTFMVSSYMDWKQYESTASIYFCMADRFKNKSKNEAIVLKETKEMKKGCTFRTIVLIGMRFLKT
jgi:hypothetical protein